MLFTFPTINLRENALPFRPFATKPVLWANSRCLEILFASPPASDTLNNSICSFRERFLRETSSRRPLFVSGKTLQHFVSTYQRFPQVFPYGTWAYITLRFSRGRILDDPTGALARESKWVYSVLGTSITYRKPPRPILVSFAI